MHPVLFEIGGREIYSYGVMLGLSLVVAWFVIMELGERREGLSREVMATTFIVTAIVAIVFSRVLYIVTNLEEMGDPLEWLDLRKGGLVAYGGFLGGLLGSWLVLRRHPNVSLNGWADVTAPTLGLGLGLTRIGCYLFGCDFGATLSADAPKLLRDWGTFPRESPAWVHHVTTYDHSPLSNYSLPVHPTQLYESAFGFALAGFAFWLWSRRRFRGQVILAVTGLYGTWRFLIEYVRDDPERGFYFGFSTSQLISLALVPAVGFAYHALSKAARAKGRAPSAADETDEEAAPDSAPASTKKRARKKKKR